MKSLSLLLVVASTSTAVADPRDLSVFVGGGVVQFTDPDMRSLATKGAGWDARLVYPLERYISIEAVYAGSLHSIDATGMPSHAYLLGTGVDLELRVGMRYEPGVEPYFFAGLGWAHYRLTRTTANTSTMRDVDNIGQIPAGLGIAFHRGRVIVDLRAAHRVTTWVDSFAGRIENGLDSWTLTLGVGFHR